MWHMYVHADKTFIHIINKYLKKERVASASFFLLSLSSVRLKLLLIKMLFKTPEGSEDQILSFYFFIYSFLIQYISTGFPFFSSQSMPPTYLPLDLLLIQKRAGLPGKPTQHSITNLSLP